MNEKKTVMEQADIFNDYEEIDMKGETIGAPKIKDALELACENYREYGKYVAQGRAYPSIYEGATKLW